jgi:hypothetical protein
LVNLPVFPKRISAQLGLIAQFGLIALLLVPLASCSKGPTSKSLQDAFAADPRLKSSPTSSPSSQVQIPPKFPGDIPKYPNATLVEASSTGELPVESSPDLLTRWTSGDSSDRVITFYRDELQKNGWKLSKQPNDANQGSFEASRDRLQVAVAVQSNGQAGTGIAIETKNSSSDAAQSSATSSVPKPSDPDFIGPVPQSDTTSSDASDTTSSQSSPSAQNFTDLEKAPQQLRQFTKDLAQLGVLTPSASKDKSKPSNTFEPNKGITRREYARWLVATNNRIYASRPARQIRLGVDTSQPAFQDVSVKDPDFAAIQGLAEAGLLPSPMSGDSTAVLFRPNAPLSREDLILWKVPVDTRQALPTATIGAVKQTWGFQDAERIDSKALRAVFADYQNGDQANIRRAFGYTTLFQPKRPVTRAEAAAVLWYFGFQGDGISAQDALKGNAKG